MFKYFVSTLFFLLTVFSLEAKTNSKNLLIILTGANELSLKNGESYKTGYWLEEFTVPYEIFEEAGIDISIATPNGNIPTVDPSSAGIGKNGKPLYWNSIKELNNAVAIKNKVLDKGKILSLKNLSRNLMQYFFQADMVQWKI